MRRRGWLGAAAIAAASLSLSRPASAHGQEAALVVLGLVAADGTFMVYDLIALGDGSHSKGWLWTQTILTAPQALAANLVPFLDDQPLLGAQIWLSQLTAFGMYGLARPRVSTSTLYGLSWAIGADAAITSYVAGTALDSRLAPRDEALTEVVASVPQLAFAVHAVLSPSRVREERATVLALGGWSSAILTHGVASLLLYRPKAPPPVRKPAAHPKTSWQLCPALVATEWTAAPGLVARGAF